MSFYGNIKNASRTQFYFDRIYPNRYTMDKNASKDNIFAGRYVLVEYEQDLSEDMYMKCCYYQGEMYNTLFTTTVKSARTGISIDAATGPMEDTIWVDDPNKIQVCVVPAGQHYSFNTKTPMYIKMTSTRGDYENVYEADYKTYLEDHADAADPVAYLIDGELYTEQNYVKDQVIKVLPSRIYSVSVSDEYFKRENKTWIILNNDNSVFVKNANLDASIPAYEGRNYDSTVWQKIYVGNEEKYILIADLNAISPVFDFTTDAPTVTPIPVHYGDQKSNTNYDVHIQAPWGLRMKSADSSIKIPTISKTGAKPEKTPLIDATVDAEKTYPSDFGTVWKGDFYDLNTKQATSGYFDPKTSSWVATKPKDAIPGAIYINKAGFNPAEIHKGADLIDEESPFYDETITLDSIEDAITLEPTGYSGRVYHNHAEKGGYTPAPDMQELSIMLPSIGDAISDMWDIVYGGVETNEKIAETHERNMDIMWEDARDVVKREGLRSVLDNKKYFDTKAVETLAGCINTVHDLMGMIIVKNADTMPIDKLEDNYIYLFEDGTYRRRAIDYEYDEINYKYEQVKLDVFSYKPKQFYIKNGNGEYVVCEEAGFDVGKTYYGKVTNTAAAEFTEVYVDEIPEGGLFIKTDVDPETEKYNYKKVRDISYGVDYLKFVGRHEVHDIDQYDPYKYFYIARDDKYKLDMNDEPSAGRQYIEMKTGTEKKVNFPLINPLLYNKEDNTYRSDDEYTEDGLPVYKKLAYVYAPGWFYTLQSENGSSKLIKETRDYSRLNLSQKYYIVSGSEKGSGLIQDENGDWVVAGPGDQVEISGDFYEVTLLPPPSPFHRYFYVSELGISPEGFEIPTEYTLLTTENLEAAYQNEFSYKDDNTKNFLAIYEMTWEVAGGFYAPGTYYYEAEDGSYIIDTNSHKTIDRPYYSPIDMEELTGKNFYIQNFYYIRDTEGQYTLDTTGEYDPEQTYYLYSRNLYVIEDTNFVFARNAEWNRGVKIIPPSVSLGTRKEVVTTVELVNFGRTLNTINGLIVQANRILETGNYKTRDRNTVQGCINFINDIINKIDTLRPDRIVITDNYGRITTSSISASDLLRMQQTINDLIKRVKILEGDTDAEQDIFLTPHKVSYVFSNDYGLAPDWIAEKTYDAQVNDILTNANKDEYILSDDYVNTPSWISNKIDSVDVGEVHTTNTQTAEEGE